MKILIVQTAFLGDLVLSTPVFDTIKELYPDADLHLLTTKAGKELFSKDRRFSNTISFDKRRGYIGAKQFLATARTLRAERYDRVYSLHRSFRSAFLLWCAGIRKRVGFRDAVGSFFYTERVTRELSHHAVTRFLSLLSAEGEDHSYRQFYEKPLSFDLSVDCPVDLENATILVPGSAWKTKQWHWTHFRQVAMRLAEQGRKVVLAGSDSEHELCEKIRAGSDQVSNFAGKLTLSEFVSMVYAAEGLVCNDSFALHVGSAAQVPTVAVFCATSPEFGFGPWMNDRACVVEKVGLWCKPCRRHGSTSCPTGTELCMRGVSANEVLGALDQVSKKHKFVVLPLDNYAEIKTSAKQVS